MDYQGPNDENKELADSFDSMLLRLETSFKDQESFTSNLAHEIRTPLATLRASLDYLANEPDVELVQFRDFTASAISSLSNLEQLVKDLLLISRGEKELHFETVYVQVLIEEIILVLASLADENEVHIAILGKSDLQVTGDDLLLHQAFLNLIQNGILYNKNGGQLEVFLEEANEWKVIRVKDQGVGISSEDQVHIFERFFRAKKTPDSAVKGSGLGLAITEHIIKLHNGRIEVQSQPGKGSMFSVYLPTEHLAPD